MLKKQTVWLLTLLSLMIVLSIYHMNSPEADDFSFIFQEEDADSTSLTANDLPEVPSDQSFGTDLEMSEEESGFEDADISSITTNDDQFTLIRMELAESRSSQREHLESVVASSVASGQEKNNAYEEIQQIDQLSSKELIIEESLKAEYGYPDVLVRSMEERVVVTVKTDELSDQEANQIMRTVHDEFGSVRVEVKFQPSST